MKSSLTVLIAVLLVGFITGCGTLSTSYSTKLLGDVPQIGKIVYVHSVFGHETEGPYETFVIWQYKSADGLPSGKMKTLVVHRGLPAGISETGAKSSFLIVSNDGKEIAFEKLN